MGNNLLGKSTPFPTSYAPDLLFAIPRADARREAFGSDALPFHGVDIWNAWEVSWLDINSKPSIATLEVRVDADSPNIVESKSLKLYLGSLAFERYGSAEQVRKTIETDLSGTVGMATEVKFVRETRTVASLPGRCIDDIDVECNVDQVDASLLRCLDGEAKDESLHSNLVYSNCPVTNQPDTGSVLVHYSGSRIDPAGLLQYITSYRRHNAFHETCVEQMFVDIQRHCEPEQLTVYARYNRRGGIDINPFRSNFAANPENARLWRQ